MANPGGESIRVEASDDGRAWTLLHPITYVTNDGRRIEVPAGYKTDFASVPRALWWLLPPFGRYLYAAIIHDRLYGQHNSGHWKDYSRAYADRIFAEVMRASSVKVWMRWLLWAGVRAGGWAYWE